MDRTGFSQDLGKKLVMSQHEFYEAMKGHDLDHISNLKRIILTISAHLKSDGVSEDEADRIAENLKGFSRTLFMNGCVEYRDDEVEELVKEESEMWFDYVWENERYPR
jgi:hypothetical protein